jgi:hypothetical protein
MPGINVAIGGGGDEENQGAEPATAEAEGG